ncbi:MAG: AI-2E family transporter [candidate division KSB1 bacterium]|nr:AI-2E family transporter [candidate division KSB1 bacterium]MDZ7273173.1 AI-2E family transporter [candidate division KSB1 bacterium]MDZ7285275.1 AI-2E family transporter [candidate division KSB1 bacterium]MDZ7298307.1 AI-2E family transporter [candidate division KSB1 bacterium]MDZ7307382.1 AI-2E family transporter [candidate division KSB1 bacterium]
MMAKTAGKTPRAARFQPLHAPPSGAPPLLAGLPAADTKIVLVLDRKLLRRAARTMLLLAVLAGLVWLLPRITPVLTMLTTALLLTTALDPLVTFLENRDLPRTTAVVFVLLLALLVGLILIRLLVPVISQEVQSLAAAMDAKAFEQIITRLKGELAGKIPLLRLQAIDEKMTAQLQSLVAGFLQNAFAFMLGLLSAAPNAVLVAFMVFFLLKDGRPLKKALIASVPNRYFEMALLITHKMTEQLSRYLQGQLLVAAAVAGLSVLALYLLQVPYYFFIGVLAGLANVIPYFGPIVGAVPAILMALLHTGSLNLVLAIVIAFATIQLIENIFISPYITARSVELHPLAILVVILIGGSLLGMWGMLLAVPVASLMKVTAELLIWGVRNYRLSD